MSNKKPNLSNVVRNNIAQFLLSHWCDEKLEPGVVKEAAAQFQCCRRTISTIWKRAKQQIQQGEPIMLCNKKKGSIKPTRRVTFDAEIIKQIPLKRRGTLRRLAHELNTSTTTIWRWVKKGKLKPHTSAIKPILNRKNKISRLKFCLNALHVERPLNVIKFKSMSQIVHIDEKWFNLTKTTDRYYLCDGESEPYRSCQNKKFITKVMFLCAVSRPLYENGQIVFDGKIGIFPFVETKPAKRKSKNREAGTMVTKPTASVNKDVIKDCLINQVIPAIHAKWPVWANKEIKIQQDNARPHILDSDPEWKVAANSNGFQIELVCQPANSPDTNVNDLGWFRALQSLQVETAASSIEELLVAVETSFINLAPNTLNNVFLSLQSCMVEIIKHYGHNKYKLPHMGKERLIREKRLPVDIEVADDIVKDGMHQLVLYGETADMGHVMSYLEMDNQIVLFQGQ